MKQPRSYLALTLLAGAALYFTLDLSSPGRGPVDWIVIGAVVAAILWNLFRLGGRLHATGGNRAVGHEMRTITFWLVGLMNTVWARPEDVGSWKWWVGLVLLALAIVDTVALAGRERRAMRANG